VVSEAKEIWPTDTKEKSMPSVTSELKDTKSDGHSASSTATVERPARAERHIVDQNLALLELQSRASTNTTIKCNNWCLRCESKKNIFLRRSQKRFIGQGKKNTAVSIAAETAAGTVAAGAGLAVTSVTAPLVYGGAAAAGTAVLGPVGLGIAGGAAAAAAVAAPLIAAANVAYYGCPGIGMQEKGQDDAVEVKDETCHKLLAMSWTGSPSLENKCDNLCGEGDSIASISVYRAMWYQEDNCWNDGGWSR